jgi:ATP-dependent Lon protease
MLLALASAHSGKPLKPGFATTGEITLRGRVLGVGGLRDKLLAAAAAGITDVILPQENEDDLEDLPMGARNKLRLHLVRNAGEALALVL